MSVVGLATVAFVESPQQVASRSAAAPATAITATVRWQVLRNAITVQGIVRSARRIEVAASAPFPTVTVTRLPVKPGSRVRPGQLLAEIDGRPIFLLRGRLPPYRNLRKGDHGPDVAQLQRALEGLGYANFDPPGVFGPSTALSLLLFYRHLGYAAPVLHTRSPGTSGAAGGGGGPLGDGGGIPDVYLPKSEVVFIPGKSALVVSVGARVGRQPGTAPVLTLATGRPYVTGRLTAHQAAQARKGIPAIITAASPALTARGTVTRIGPLPATGGARGYPVRVRSTRPLPQRMIGAQVRLTLEAAVTAAPVLTVPVAAIIAAGHGRPTRVLKVTAARQHVSVPVFTGPTAGGFVAVQPMRRASLRPGDRVLVGARP
jgi:peptidoglycan hydrolase-like protein with peptidoglycan-binding domain